MAKHIYFVRHGESESNAEKIFRGTHTSLTEKGREQAQLVAERFVKIPIDIIVTSSFPRAIETGMIIAELIAKPIDEHLDILVEYERPPEMIGLLWDDEKRLEIIRRTEEEFVRGGRYSTEETFSELLNRAKQTLVHLEARSEQNILVVSHGKFIRFLVGLVCLGDSLSPEIFHKFDWTLRSSNTGITRMEIEDDGRWTVWQWNDRAHLG